MRIVRRAVAGIPLAPLIALLAVVVLAGCAGGAATSSPVATSTVDLPKSYRFAPAAITVPSGTTVTWSNNDNFTHNVTLADGTPAMTMPPGATATHTFATAGVYAYHCSLHPKDMQGSVLVTGS